MEKLNLTTLRSRLFQVADHVLESGEPVLIERNGRTLLLSPQEAPSRLARLQRRSLVTGDAEDLAELKISEWHELANLG
jgi:PHD/YefM family antitoxin component YafN of YafNO toxin-antitoxin module